MGLRVPVKREDPLPDGQASPPTPGVDLRELCRDAAPLPVQDTVDAADPCYRRWVSANGWHQELGTRSRRPSASGDDFPGVLGHAPPVLTQRPVFRGPQTPASVLSMGSLRCCTRLVIAVRTSGLVDPRHQILRASARSHSHSRPQRAAAGAPGGRTPCPGRCPRPCCWGRAVPSCTVGGAYWGTWAQRVRPGADSLARRRPGRIS